MANTRTAAKRARQAKKRQSRNTIVKSATKSALRSAMEALKTQDVSKVKEAYAAAVKALAKAGSKGAIPKPRASRKIGRLTRLLKKTLPASVAK